jgi:pyruvate,water dikinase
VAVNDKSVLDGPWLVDNPPSQTYPVYTRANVGEVFPDPVTPMSWTIAGIRGAEWGWRDALVRFGVFDADEFSTEQLEVLGVFGGYCYLNVSVSRIMGVRTPGLTPEAIDFSFFGTQPDVPPYEPRAQDESPAHTARAGATLQDVLTASDVAGLDDQRRSIAALRAARPDLAAMSDQELVARVREVMGQWFRPLFEQHLFNLYSATVPAGIIAGVCDALGDPTLAMRLVAGLGGVDSAAPSWAMWALGRQVAASPTLRAAFDAGLDGLADRLRVDGDEQVEAFVGDFDRFLYEFGSRGCNEWEMRSATWETEPDLALAAIDRMRLAPDGADPQRHHDAVAADRLALQPTVLAQLEADPDAAGQLAAALAAAAVWFPARERSKTTIIRMVHECRVMMHELGRRMVERGHFADVGDFAMLREDELDAFLADPTAFVGTIVDRKEWYDELARREPPFIVVGAHEPASSWPRRDGRVAEVAGAGDVLAGIPGCPGQATGRAKVIHDPADPRELEPGDVLVAPLTDPAWTPLFVPAAAVVVDVGAQLSHAVIVSRELGIPCVVSVTAGTERIPDGALVTVDGTAGTVTVH